MITPKPELTFQCSEDWDQMKVGLVSRFCENCKRDVQDFTKLSRQEILQYLWTNRNTKVCGRVFKSQLDYHHEEILVTIDAYLHKNKTSNLSFYLLAMGSLMLAGCSGPMDSKNSAMDSLTLALNDSDERLRISIDSSVIQSYDSTLDIPTVGFITTSKPDNTWSQFEGSPKGCRIFAEVMPEYIGGYDSLISFLHKNVQYPRWEKRKRIAGTVYVRFIVDETGKIKEPTILRTVEGSRNFNAEVIRVINSMPDWKPGQEQGENVPVMFTIPVRFRL